MSDRLFSVPIHFDEARAFIEQHHRHRRPPTSAKFPLAVSDGKRVVGVATCGRPVARGLDDGWTLEVTRVATDGTRNACSFLYRLAWRIARELGYRRVVTYTLDEESGASLRGAGFKIVGEVRARSWSCSARPRVDKYPKQRKISWECETKERERA